MSIEGSDPLGSQSGGGQPPRRVLHVVENLSDTYGGPARSVPNLMTHLGACGIDGKALSVSWAWEESNDVISANALEWERFSLSGPRKIGFSPNLSRALAGYCSEGTSPLHLHNLWNYVAYICWRRCKQYSVPLIVSPRGSLYPWSLQQGKYRKALAWRLFQAEALNEAAFVHVTDKSEAEEVRRLGIRAPIAIVPNGVEQIPLTEQQRLKDVRRARSETVGRSYLFMSRIHRKKGVDILLEAWARSSARTRGCTLSIIGPSADKAYADELQSIIARHDMQDSVSMHGMIKGDEREAAFENADFFILPSHTENFGIVIAEALARGLPVLTTKGTPWEALNQTNSGWWVDLSLDSIARLIDDTSRLERTEICLMGDKAINLARQFAWEEQAQKMASAYRWIYGAAKPSFVYLHEESFDDGS